MKRLFLYILFFLFFSNISNASKSLVYSKYIQSQNKEHVIQHLLSVESGMSWMQTWSKKYLYCVPEKFKMNIHTAKDAIELGVEDFKSRNILCCGMISTRLSICNSWSKVNCIS